jgi:hypothetical protein
MNLLEIIIRFNYRVFLIIFNFYSYLEIDNEIVYDGIKMLKRL